MQETQPSIFDNEVEEFITPRRIELLPWWIRVCCWFFLIMGGIGTPVLIYTFFGGQETRFLFGDIASSVAIFMSSALVTYLFLKGLVAFALLTGKKWAITLATIDGIINMLLSIFAMIQPYIDNVPGHTFKFRFEILVLICYLWKLNQISREWQNSRP